VIKTECDATLQYDCHKESFLNKILHHQISGRDRITTKFIKKSHDGNHRQQYLQQDSTPTVLQKIYNLLGFFKFTEEQRCDRSVSSICRLLEKQTENILLSTPANSYSSYSGSVM
jgi:hypothetical protein